MPENGTHKCTNAVNNVQHIRNSSHMAKILSVYNRLQAWDYENGSALPVTQPTVSKDWREKYHIPRTFHVHIPIAHLKLTMGLPTLSLTTKGSWLPWRRVVMPLISPLMPVPQYNITTVTDTDYRTVSSHDQYNMQDILEIEHSAYDDCICFTNTSNCNWYKHSV